jgi:hypothetical protein
MVPSVQHSSDGPFHRYGHHHHQQQQHRITIKIIMVSQEHPRGIIIQRSMMAITKNRQANQFGIINGLVGIFSL